MDENALPEPNLLKSIQVLQNYGGGLPKKKKVADMHGLSPIIPLTQAEWDQFNGKARWDCTVALRGPDLVSSNNLKFVTSSVIRHKMSGIMRVGGLINSYLPFVIVPSDLYGLKTGIFDASHFVGHIQEAATYLHIPIMWINTQAFKDLFLEKRSSKDCLGGLLKLDELSEQVKSCIKSYMAANLGLPEDYS